ncbi:MAG: DUF3365 domain-containing protein [Deferribacterales bacterium]
MRNIQKISMYFASIILLWTVLIAWFSVDQYRDYENSIIDIATKEANLTYYKDALYRKWGAQNGGVYVPVSEFTQPNPYMSQIPDRDITTTDGKTLTLVNPAYMTRLVFEMADNKVLQGHLTSDKYLNPANKPDEWEVEALRKIYKGAQTVSEQAEINSKPYLRFMKPFVIDETCMKCHGYQGYNVGDIRGGISVEVPLKDYYQTLSEEKGHIWISGLTIWALGLTILTFTYFMLTGVVRKEERLNIYRTTLFREFNHRVKNNLQLLTSMIDIYMMQGSEKTKNEALRDIQERMSAMSELHDMFTIKKNDMVVSAESYIRNICTTFSKGKSPEVEFVIKADKFTLQNAKALSCGLIINELITNSYKHAFDALTLHPTIEISMTKDGDVVTLDYKDNGSGFNNLVKKKDSYGLMLIESIADKINAKYHIDGSEGFHAKFTFEL